MAVEIRPYAVGDRAELVALFGAAGQGAPAAEGWGHEPSLADLRIDLLPAVRGVGAGEGLMAAWFDRLWEVGSPGCYLHTSAENVKAVRFFERMGMTKHGDNPVVPGLRHEGQRMHQQTMVWSA